MKNFQTYFKKVFLCYSLFLYGSCFCGEKFRTGCIYPSEEKNKQIEDNIIDIKKVYINKLALKRINEYRRSKKFPKICENDVNIYGQGDEVYGISKNNLHYKKALIVSKGGNISIPEDIELPKSVDNSTTDWFPPIRSQGYIGSCACFSAVYYTGTYMIAKERNIKVKDGDNNKVLSPKFIYNLINGGYDLGSWIFDAYEAMAKHGMPIWGDWPYDDNYKEWPLDAQIWRNSIFNRMESYGKVSNIDTEDGLKNLKTMLANGYIFNYACYIRGWEFSTIKDDLSTSLDNDLIGKRIAIMSTKNSSGHAMTIVGFNDEAWCDINNNGKIDKGEKGCLKICNSWGTEWEDKGFSYISYDALKQKSEVEGVIDSDLRTRLIWNAQVGWIIPKKKYSPLLLAEFVINSAKRNQIYAKIGRGEDNSSYPSIEWTPVALRGSGGAFSFNGTTNNIVDCTFVFDFTDIFSASVQKNWFIKLTDTVENNKCILKSYKLTNCNGSYFSSCFDTNPKYNSFPIEIDFSTLLAWAKYKETDISNYPPQINSLWSDSINNGKEVQVHVIASDSDDDQLKLTYSWYKKSGPGNVCFNQNYTTESTNVIASFDCCGFYEVQIDVSDGKNCSSKTIGIDVPQIFCTININPDKIVLNNGERKIFNLKYKDQFGNDIKNANNEKIKWKLDKKSIGKLKRYKYNGNITYIAPRRKTGNSILRAYCRDKTSIALIEVIDD